jgi:hypothetical protein
MKWSVKTLSSQGNKTLKVQPYKIIAIQQLFPLDWKARRQYCRLFQEILANGFIWKFCCSQKRHNLRKMGM